MARSYLTQSLLKSILKYNQKTGIFTWLERSPDMFKNGIYNKERRCKRWNTRYAGKQIKCINDNGYIEIKITKKTYKSHVLAYFYVNGFYPKGEIDHINGKRSDNRIINLRAANRSQNQANSKIRSDNTSGYKGVTFHKKTKKWAAQISYNGKRIYLGLFKTLCEAHAAYCEAAQKLHKRFANFG